MSDRAWRTLWRQTMSDRVPTFGDRIMVQYADGPRWYRAVVVPARGMDALAGAVKAIDSDGDPFYFAADGQSWRWPESGEWEADDE